MLKIARCTRRPAFFLCYKLCRSFSGRVVLHIQPAVTRVSAACAWQRTLERRCRSSTSRSPPKLWAKKINGVRVDLSESVLERGIEYSDHKQCDDVTCIISNWISSGVLLLPKNVDRRLAPSFSIQHLPVIRCTKSNLPLLLSIWKKWRNVNRLTKQHAANSNATSVSRRWRKSTRREEKAPQPLYHTTMMNYSKVPLSLGVPMPFCNGEELPPKCGRGSSSAAGRQGSCEGWKTPVLRKQKGVESRPRLWLHCTSQGFSPSLLSFFYVRSCGLVVFCRLCAVRCGVVARSNKTTLFILGLEVYNCVIWW